MRRALAGTVGGGLRDGLGVRVSGNCAWGWGGLASVPTWREAACIARGGREWVAAPTFAGRQILRDEDG